MTSKRVVFLDFDGVLNNRQFIDALKADEEDDYAWRLSMIDPAAVTLLNGFVEEANASIVISSSWRNGQNLQELKGMLNKKGLKNPNRVIGETPHIHGGPRGKEIQAWLDSNKDYNSFVILDDNDDMDGLLHCFVKTDPREGLTAHSVEYALAILERDIPHKSKEDSGHALCCIGQQVEDPEGGSSCLCSCHRTTT